jgi:hypothetical protein
VKSSRLSRKKLHLLINQRLTVPKEGLNQKRPIVRKSRDENRAPDHARIANAVTDALVALVRAPGRVLEAEIGAETRTSVDAAEVAVEAGLRIVAVVPRRRMTDRSVTIKIAKTIKAKAMATSRRRNVLVLVHVPGRDLLRRRKRHSNRLLG